MDLGGRRPIFSDSQIARVLNERSNGEDLRNLITYLASAPSGMSTAFERDSGKSEDLYKNLDLASGTTPSRVTSAPKAPPVPQRQFKRPGTTAPTPAPAQMRVDGSKRYVFVVRGRDQAAYEALEAFLMALDLGVITWNDATRHAGGGSPYTLDIVSAGIELSQAVVVLLTPDDLGKVKSEFRSDRDDPREEVASGQARQNVVFEAGWAMALNREGVVLVRVGEIRAMSDIEGLNYVQMTGDISSRRQLINKLKNCRLAVEESREEWRTAGSFPENL